MKRTTLLLTLLLFILAMPLSLPAAEKQAGSSKTAQERASYEKSMQERLGKLGAQLDELKKKADAEKESAAAKMKVYLADAEKKRQVAARKLEELGRASKDTWEKFSADLDRAAKDFEHAFERARGHKE